jgi:hypothetical protein
LSLEILRLFAATEAFLENSKKKPFENSPQASTELLAMYQYLKQ